MPSLLSRYATPLISGLFVVSLVSGVALFFHVGMAQFHEMHEILSMVLIAPFVLHLWRNWRPFVNYFKRPPMLTASAISLVAALAFVIPTLGQSGTAVPPQVAAMNAITEGNVQTVAPLFGHTPESLAEALRQNGYTVTALDRPLSEIADTSSKSGRDILMTLVSAKQ